MYCIFLLLYLLVAVSSCCCSFLSLFFFVAVLFCLRSSTSPYLSIRIIHIAYHPLPYPLKDSNLFSQFTIYHALLSCSRFPYPRRSESQPAAVPLLLQVSVAWHFFAGVLFIHGLDVVHQHCGLFERVLASGLYPR